MLNITFNNSTEISKKQNISFGARNFKKIPVLDNFIRNSLNAHRKIYDIPDSIISIPGMSEEALCILDFLPISLPHLLLLYKDKFIYSLAEKANTKEFINDFYNLINVLKKLYANHNIIFFEHGSGNAKINGLTKTVSAGKSINIAHGHFCIMPKDKKSFFDPILTEAQKLLQQNSWKNIDSNTITDNGMLPNFGHIFGNLGYKKPNEFPPYLCLSEYSAQTDSTKCALIVQQDAQTKTPSQLFRILIAKRALSKSDARFWDWKTFFPFIENCSEIPEAIQKRIENIKLAADALRQKLQMFNSSVLQG